MKQNPYNPIRPATEEVFVGRENLKRQLTIGLQTGLCFGIVGAPGIGKTSLLLAVKRKLAATKPKQGKIPLPVYVDCTRHHKSAEAILTLFVKDLVEALHVQRNLLCPADIQEQCQTKAEQGELASALKLIFEWAFEQEKRTHQPILLLDNLHRASGSPWIYELASIFNTPVDKQELTLVLSGEQALAGELRDDTSPLRHLISQHHDLKPLTRTETHALVAKSSDCSWDVEEGCAELAHELTNGHSYRLHYYLCRALLAEGKLTVEGLIMQATPETEQYLDELLNTEEQMNQPTVFVSYSHEDEEEKDRLLSHLGVVQTAGLIDVWNDDRLGAGADWKKEIREAMAQARVAILLISANFLTSDFILGEEVPALLKRRKREGLTVFPVIAKACAWKVHDWLTKMNVRPKNGTPVWRDAGIHVDEDLAAIAEEVAAIVRGDA